MAKTPLFAEIRRRFLEHRALRAVGLPPSAAEELRGRARERASGDAAARISRRGFVAGLGAGAVLLGAPRVVRAAGPAPTIAIVGGGIAGVSCALSLADKNVASTVYEASGRIGGRMFSNTSGTWQNGQVSEWCGELIDTGHATIRKLAKRFGLPLDNLLAAQPAGAQDTYRLGGAYYSAAQASADFAPVFDAVTTDLNAAGYPTTFDSFTAAGAQLDAMTVRHWINTRVPGGHTSPLGKLLDLAYAIEFGADTTDQSALSLIYLLGYQPKPNKLAVFGESDERFHIRGGNQQLPQAIADSLAPGSVKLGHRMTKIKQTPAGRYVVTFETGNCTTDVTADYVVMALPFAVLRGLDYAQAGFDSLKDEAIQDLGRGHNGKLQLQLSSRLWNQTGPWPGVGNGSTYADTGYQASWEVSRAQAGATGILCLYSGGSVTDSMKASGAFGTATSAGVAADITAGRSQINAVFPGISALYNGKATQSLPHKSSFFGASYSYFRVGQYTGFAGYEGARQGGVLFCGEHTSQDFQGFMEGGASEGERAAGDLLKII
ncbi:MAG: NAD(P)/FAD-dependent oxidoreductase [Byssovorax sp.]